ncbi:MAG: DUF58 domain-containing protein [Actinomycetota bacterium]
MPRARGSALLAAGISLLAVARLFGSPTMFTLGAGLVALPLVATLQNRLSRTRLSAARRLSASSVTVGEPVKVEIEVENGSVAASGVLLIEDGAPEALGNPARLVLSGVPARRKKRIAYSITPSTRGRFEVGPLQIETSDSFFLTRGRLRFEDMSRLVVKPAVEPLRAEAGRSFGAGGEGSSGLPFRSSEEFWTIREYQIGDDLRRIHWRSVARSGKLMIRQDEAASTPSTTILLDTRNSALGRSGSPGFERAVSAAASVAIHMLRSGFSLRVATTESDPETVDDSTALEILAGLQDSPSSSLLPRLERIRRGTGAGSAFIVVTAPPTPPEIAELSRAASDFAPRTAVLVYPADLQSLSPGARETLRGRASVAERSLSRAGWSVFVIGPSDRLRDIWKTRTKGLPAAAGSLR